MLEANLNQTSNVLLLLPPLFLLLFMRYRAQIRGDHKRLFATARQHAQHHRLHTAVLLREYSQSESVSMGGIYKKNSAG